MREYGSDFHYFLLNNKRDMNNENEIFNKKINYYSSGRSAIIDLINFKKWKRIWLPVYFCYQVIDSIKSTGIEVVFYDDEPNNKDYFLNINIETKKGDVLFLVNYFGFRIYRKIKFDIDIIEDHTHDLCSSWALNSNADFCIASIRKSLPIPEGGILWSPKKLLLPVQISSSEQNDQIVYKRIAAMLLKSEYINEISNEKELYRKLFLETEEYFDSYEISGMSAVCKQLLKRIDINQLYEIKRNNWLKLKSLLNKEIKILQPDDIDSCTPFALVIIFDSEKEMIDFRLKLIENMVYPAILWNIPDRKLSNYFLSIHCDFRYSYDDILSLAKIINNNW